MTREPRWGDWSGEAPEVVGRDWGMGVRVVDSDEMALGIAWFWSQVAQAALTQRCAGEDAGAWLWQAHARWALWETPA